MSVAIIYHEVKQGIPCADGIAAAWVAKRKYPEAKLIGASYNRDLPEVSEFDQLLIVDFSFSLPVLQEWQKTKDVRVIDHHKTAMADLEGFSNAVFDMNECGATLTWKTLFPDEPMPAWLRYVRDRDLWDFVLPNSEEIHEAVSFMGRTFRQMDWLCSLSHKELQATLAPLGAKLLEPKRKRIAELAATGKTYEIKGYCAIAVEIPESETRLVSDTCSAIYRAHPEVEFVVSYSRNSKDDLWSLGFRSDKNGSDFDVSAIARLFGGGGHRNAAGATVKDLSGLLG